VPDKRHSLCVSLHGVAPATLDDCRDTLAFLDAMRVSPVALLVVPDYHGLGRADKDAGFCRFLRERADHGDEIVLHGFCHQDGEFSRLSSDVARLRILRGLAVMRAAGWQPDGFVAPAWLMSPGTQDALESLPLKYCATRDFIFPLGSDRRISAPSLVVSTRSMWRRGLSPVWNQLRLARGHASPVSRVALHPRDIRYGAIESLWRRLLGQLASRSLVTEVQLVRPA
jgi:predicted deacetylase